MSTATNDDPVGDDYWATFETAARLAEEDRIRRNELYGSQGDPGTGGWRGGVPVEPSADAYRASAPPSGTAED